MPFPGLAKSLPPLLLGLTLTSLDSANAFELFLGTPELPEVLTATRLKQAPAAVPGSISVLDRELIQASGARELTELLRLVPGMIVVTDDIKVQVNYHGGHAAQARRMQVLIDGRSVYRPGLPRSTGRICRCRWKTSSASRYSAAPTQSAMGPTL